MQDRIANPGLDGIEIYGCSRRGQGGEPSHGVGVGAACV